MAKKGKTRAKESEVLVPREDNIKNKDDAKKEKREDQKCCDKVSKKCRSGICKRVST